MQNLLKLKMLLSFNPIIIGLIRGGINFNP